MNAAMPTPASAVHTLWFPTKGPANVTAVPDPLASLHRLVGGGGRALPGTACRSLARHLSAGLRAAPTGLGALLAVVRRMAFAFLAAGLANLRADLANRASELTAARHHRSGQAADLRAVHVERDAAGHLPDVGLLQAGRGAMVAGVGAGLASLNAFSELIVGHVIVSVKSGLRTDKARRLSRAAAMPAPEGQALQVLGPQSLDHDPTPFPAIWRGSAAGTCRLQALSQQRAPQ